MKSPALTLAGTRDAILTIVKAVEGCGIPKATIELVNIRVGQINGCSPCVDMHCRALKKLGESDVRVCMLATWRETPYYTEPERAALASTSRRVR
jgi:AhpD family alkylhydroperoxidase